MWGSALDAAFVRACVARFDGASGGPGPGALYKRLFTAFPTVKVLVDGSKKLDWARYHAASGGFGGRYIFVRRDLRGCYASWKRTDPVGFGRTAEAAPRRLATFDRFRADLSSRHAFDLRYEDLIADPVLQAARLCRWLGLPFEPEMISHHRHAHHLIGGNPGPLLQHGLAACADVRWIEAEMTPEQRDYYRSLSSPYSHDERWRRELDGAGLAHFPRTLGDTNAAWGYGSGDQDI